MPRRVVVDSGPLVALFSRRDGDHRRALEFFEVWQDADHATTLAVVTEVVYLLDFRRDAQLDFLQLIQAGAIEVISLEARDWDRIIELSKKYADLPIDFADATLVAICERLGTRQIATVDSDFQVYRYLNRHAFENVFLAGS